jgi:lysophospholipase L1-like esterase
MNFLKKIFSPTILIISFLLLIYTFYKSEMVWNGDNRNYYKTYYLVSSILISFSIITFFLNEKIKQILIISCVSLIGSLYLFEGYLNFKEQFLKEQLYKEQTGNKWDRRSKLQIYKDLKKKNANITITYHPLYLIDYNYSNIPFALSGLSNSETIYCNENGYYSIYQSDRYGFNNPDNEWDKKEIEYLLVGDSFTQGECINRPNDIGSVLRNLSNKSVLNLGMSGNGPLLEYATLREYLNTKVRKVLWIYFEGNDLENLEEEKKNNILIKYLKDLDFTQDLKFKQNDIDNLLSNLIEEEEEIERERNRHNFKIKLIKFIKIYNTRFLILSATGLTPVSTSTSASASASEFKQILQLTKELTYKNNSKLYFVYLPEYSRYTKKYKFTNYNLVRNIVTELKIPFIDIHEEVFVKEQNPLKLFPFELPGHYNISGYKKVAEAIYKFTKN